jgi:hypothetical protein
MGHYFSQLGFKIGISDRVLSVRLPSLCHTLSAASLCEIAPVRFVACTWRIGFFTSASSAALENYDLKKSDERRVRADRSAE